MNHKDTKTQRKSIPGQVENVAKCVVDAAFQVHSELGPGLLESVYEICLVHALSTRGISLERQVPVPVVFDGVRLESGLRLDLLVEGCLIVEIKAVEQLHPVHRAQLLTYLKLTGHRLGLLINFNVPLIKDGIKRVIL
jgi:GxxExxY protein